jgi:hypothetical protein
MRGFVLLLAILCRARLASGTQSQGRPVSSIFTPPRLNYMAVEAAPARLNRLKKIATPRPALM